MGPYGISFHQNGLRRGHNCDRQTDRHVQIHLSQYVELLMLSVMPPKNHVVTGDDMILQCQSVNVDASTHSNNSLNI